MEYENTDNPEEKPQENDIRGYVVYGKRESPDRQNCCEVAENKGDDGPHKFA
ncbi:MAG: hypothetical protein H6Q41_4721, partial [Deltaproteobacteria bacterium]|nr:hypothetical protein [Deltaproteobacteria bacterium]